MDIVLIKKKTDLLKKANASNYVTVAALARELKCSKTDLAEIIENNPKLFHLSERWEPKTKTITENKFGTRFKSTVQVRGKHLGLCVDAVFVKPEDNYLTEEWLEKTKIEKAKFLHITESDNYGYIQGYFLEIDSNKETPYRYHLWRNTPSKILLIQEFLHKETFIYGGFGDSYSVTHENAISLENIDKLRALGWEFNNFRPLS